MGAPALRVVDADAEVGVLDLAAGDQLVRDAADSLDRDRVADAGVGAGVARDLGVHPDHATVEVEQGTARVAVVQRGVGLDCAVDREAVGSLDVAVQAADDAGRDGALEPERAADGDDRVAELEVGRRARLERREPSRASCRA